MKLSIVGDLATSPLAEQWAAALRPMIIRHPDPRSTVELELTVDHQPSLCFRLDVGWDTTTPSREMRPLGVSAVTLTYFPGVQLAQAWVAAAWCSYLLHEALELVTVGDLTTRPIDPHGDANHNKCMSDGLPGVLTPSALRASLGVVMRPDEVAQMVGA